MEFVPLTRFGAPSVPLARAVSPLRARAVGLGVSVVEVGPVDLAAAVIAAETWSVVSGVSGFSSVSHTSVPARDTLSHVLMLAGCGVRAWPSPVLSDRPLPHAAAPVCWEWLHRWDLSAVEKLEAWSLASELLSVSGDGRLAAAGSFNDLWLTSEAGVIL